MLTDNTPSKPDRPSSSTTSVDILAIDPLIRPLIPYFAELTTERVNALRGALASSDFEQIKRVAHTLKGSTASYGFPAMASLAARIEVAIQAPDRQETTGPLIEAIASQHADLLRLIAAEPALFEEPEDDA